MSRIPRIKSHEYIYHIMCRSMSEFCLFRDVFDKDHYLDILSKYCSKFQCTLLAYCLMDNHVHIHLDPQGFDISRFMLCVNLSYAVYYNKKYKRHGHVFQGRFESRVVSSDKYNLAVSAYIHNNPKDMEGYRGREYEYPFSSMGIYLGLRKDDRGLVNTGFILSLFNSKDNYSAVRRYAEFVENQKKEAAAARIEKCLERFTIYEYRSERRIIHRNIKPERIIEVVSQTLGMPMEECIHVEAGRAFVEFRAYAAFILRTLGGLSYREICSLIGNISLSGTANLCKRGYLMLLEGGVYRYIFNKLLDLGAAA